MADADTESDYEELVSSLAYLCRWINAIGENGGNRVILSNELFCTVTVTVKKMIAANTQQHTTSICFAAARPTVCWCLMDNNHSSHRSGAPTSKQQ